MAVPPSELIDTYATPGHWSLTEAESPAEKGAEAEL